jgi:golgi phosphoprotein 3
MDMKLSLAEELLLLAMNDEKGTVLFRASTALPYGLAGALLIELAQAGLVRVEGKELVAELRGSAQDELLGGLLEKIRASKKPRTIGHWVTKFGFSGGKLKKKLLDRLVEKRVLGRDEGRIFGIFPTARYPQADARPEYVLRERIRSALRGMSRPDARTAALISLAHTCELIGILFEKEERRDAAKRAKEIVKSQPIGSAVDRVVQAVKASVIAAAGS